MDVTAASAIRLCDEGLAMEIDPAKHLAAAPDGTSAADDFGDLLVSECFIPQIVYSTTFGYRTDIEAWGGKTPDDICDIFDTKTFPGKRSLEKRPINNVEWALLCDGVAAADVYDDVVYQRLAVRVSTGNSQAPLSMADSECLSDGTDGLVRKCRFRSSRRGDGGLRRTEVPGVGCTDDTEIDATRSAFATNRMGR